MTQCNHCRLDLSLYPPTTPGVCPNCGKSPEEPHQAAAGGSAVQVGPGASLALIQLFWKRLWAVILSPAKFFSEEAPSLVAEGGLSSALAFAVVVQWLSAFFNFIWGSAVGSMFSTRMADFSQIITDVFQTPMGGLGNDSAMRLERMGSQAMDFLFGAGTVILTPFTTVLKLVIVAALVHIAVRFFMKETQDRPQSYSTTLKILCYATAPWILCVIPFLGMLVAWVLVFFASVIGLREVYRTTNGRAVLAVIFPDLLVMALVMAIAFLILFLAFNVMRLVF